MTWSSKAYSIVNSRAFNGVILAAILTNSVLLALANPGRKANPWEKYTDTIFSSLFFIEMVLKLVAYTVHGYFEDKWNYLDFVVVLESILSALFALTSRFEHNKHTFINISSLRALRVIRVLRTITFVPEIKVLVRTFLDSWNVVLELTVLLFMLILVFANFMESTFQHSLNFRCGTHVEDNSQVPSTESFVIFTNQLCNGAYMCTTDPCDPYYKFQKQLLDGKSSNSSMGLTHVATYRCKLEDMVCLDVGFSPYSGLFSYDDIFSSIFSVFQAITYDQWESGMFWIQDSVATAWWILYMIILLVGGLCVSNLYPAIISVQLENVLKAYEQETIKLDATAQGKVSEADTEFKAISVWFQEMEEKDQQLIQAIHESRLGYTRAAEYQEENVPRFTPTFPGSAYLREFFSAELGPFAFFIYGCTIINILMLTPQSNSLSTTVASILYGVNKFFEVVFFVEAMIKLGIFGPVGYFQDKYNCFDFAISVVGFTDACTPPSIHLSMFSGFRVLRLVRLVKIVRVLRFQKALTSNIRITSAETMDFARLVKVITESASWILYSYMLLLVLLFIASILGMQWFGAASFLKNASSKTLLGATIKSQHLTQFYGFSTFSMSTMSMFTILTGDNWVEIAFDAVQNLSPHMEANARWLAFFVVWVIVSKFFISSLIISVIFGAVKNDVIEVIGLNTISDLRAVYILSFSCDKLLQKKVFVTWKQNTQTFSSVMNAKAKDRLVLEAYLLDPAPSAWENFKNSENTFLLFSPDNRFRLAMCSLIKNPLFELVSYAAIIASSMVVAVQADIQSKINNPSMVNVTSFTPGQLRLFKVVDTFSTMVFLVDIIARSVAKGFYFLPKSFLKANFLNKLDVLITALCLVDIVHPGLPFAVIRLTRLLRVFRSLQLVFHSKHLLRIFYAVRRSLKPMCWVILFQTFLIFLFALLGVQLWSDNFQYCENPGVDSNGALKPYPLRGTVLNAENCEVIQTQELNFDSFFNGCVAAFFVFTQDNWHQVLNPATASTGPRKEPGNIGQNPWASLPFIVFIFLSNANMTLFIATVYGTFMHLQLQDDFGRTSSQKDSAWQIYRQKLCQIQPLYDPARPSDVDTPYKAKIYDVIYSKKYQLFVTAVLAVNISIVYLYGQQDKWRLSPPVEVNWVDEFFQLFYVFEWLLRLYIFDIKEVANPRELKCWIDVIVILIMIINATNLAPLGASYPLSLLVNFYNPLTNIAALRVFRMCIIRPSMMDLTYTVARSFSAVLVLFILLWMLAALYGVVVVIIYGGLTDWSFVNTNQEECITGTSIAECNDFATRHYNFDSVSAAINTLFAMVSGGEFPTFLLGLWHQHNEGAERLGHVIIFVSFLIIGRFLIINLFMMTILFEYHVHSPDQVGISYNEVKHFQECWRSQFGAGKTYMPDCPTDMALFLRGSLPKAVKKGLGLPLGLPSNISAMELNWMALKVIEEIKTQRIIRTKGKSQEKGVRDFLRRKLKNLYTKYKTISEGDEKQRSKAKPSSMLFFHEVLVAVHKFAFFGVPGSEQFHLNEDRQEARKNVGLLKLAVLRIQDKPSKYSALDDIALTRRVALDIFYQQFIDALHRYVLRFIKKIENGLYKPKCAMEAEMLCSLIEREKIVITLQMSTLKHILQKIMIGNQKYLRKLEAQRYVFDAIKKQEALIYDLKADYEAEKWKSESMQVIDNSIYSDKAKSCTAVCFSEEGTFFTATFEDGTLRIYKVRRSFQFGAAPTDSIFSEFQQIELPTMSSCLAWSQDDKHIFCGLANSHINCFTQEVRYGKRARAEKKDLKFLASNVMKGHRGSVHVLRVHGYFLVSAAADGCLMLWRFRSTEPLLRCNVSAGQFGFGSCQLFSMVIHVHEPLLNDNPPTFILTGGQDAKVSAARIVTDAAFLAAGEWYLDTTLAVFQSNKSKVKEVVTAMAICWNLLYVGGSKGTVEVLQMFVDAPTKERKFAVLHRLISIQKFGVHSAAISCMVFQNGVLFTGSHDLLVIPWKEPTIHRTSFADEAPSNNIDLQKAVSRKPTFMDLLAKQQKENTLSNEQEEQLRKAKIYHVSQQWESGIVGHTECITCMCATSKFSKSRGADLLVTGDASGKCLAQTPTQKEVLISETSLQRPMPELKEKKARLVRDAIKSVKKVITTKKHHCEPSEEMLLELEASIADICVDKNGMDRYLAAIICAYYPTIKLQISVLNPASTKSAKPIRRSSSFSIASSKVKEFTKALSYKLGRGQKNVLADPEEKMLPDQLLNASVHDLKEQNVTTGVQKLPEESGFESEYSLLPKNPSEAEEEAMIKVNVNGWSCTVPFLSNENISWILYEVMRMHCQEKSPLLIIGLSDVETGKVLSTKSLIGEVLVSGAELKAILKEDVISKEGKNILLNGDTDDNNFESYNQILWKETQNDDVLTVFRFEHLSSDFSELSSCTYESEDSESTEMSASSRESHPKVQAMFFCGGFQDGWMDTNSIHSGDSRQYQETSSNSDATDKSVSEMLFCR